MLIIFLYLENILSCTAAVKTLRFSTYHAETKSLKIFSAKYIQRNL